MRSGAQISIITSQHSMPGAVCVKDSLNLHHSPVTQLHYHHHAANKETEARSGVLLCRASAWVPTQADCSQLPHYRVSACVPGQGLAPCTGPVSSWSLPVTRKSTS